MEPLKPSSPRGQDSFCIHFYPCNAIGLMLNFTKVGGAAATSGFYARGCNIPQKKTGLVQRFRECRGDIAGVAPPAPNGCT